MPKIVGHVTQVTATFRENYLCARLALPIQSRVPNLNSPAQVVFEILRSKRIGVTSLTFQGHATSSVTWPFGTPYKGKGKGRGRTLDIAPQVDSHHKGAQVHGAHQAASHVPALYVPSYEYSRYSFTDPERMEGWVSPCPECKEQLAHGCCTTARSQRTPTRDRWSSALTTIPSRHHIPFPIGGPLEPRLYL